jgi:DNA-binding transcriptional LysR family regulator
MLPSVAGGDQLCRGAIHGVEHLRAGLKTKLSTFEVSLEGALPVVFGTREGIPRLPAFLNRHPLLRIEQRVSDLYQDLVAEGVDVAIRPRDPHQKARRLHLRCTPTRDIAAIPGGVPFVP